MLALFLIIVSALVLTAWLLSIDMFINAGKAKGYSMANSGKLWFIGIIATPLVVGLYVAALPDNRKIVDVYKRQAWLLEPGRRRAFDLGCQRG